MFRSEIDYLPPEYEGVEELAEHVKEVIAGRKESMVDRTNTIVPTEQDDKRLQDAAELEKQLSELSLSRNGDGSGPVGSHFDNPYGD